RSAESAMAKQLEWAAATSSSGVVPTPVFFSKRRSNVYGVSENVPLAAVTRPLPSFSPPSHVADAVLFIARSPRVRNAGTWIGPGSLAHPVREHPCRTTGPVAGGELARC